MPQLFARLETLQHSIDRRRYQFEFLFINDGSQDHTLELIQIEQQHNPAIAYLNLSRNFGKEAAMLAGFDHAAGDAVVVIDADLQDPPELIPQMIELWEQGYDDVYARRRSRSGETWLKKKTAAWYYRLLQSTTHIPVQIDTGDFRLLSKRCVTAITQLRESQRNTKAIFSWVGYKKKEILYDRDPRAAGSIKQSPRTPINLAIYDRATAYLGRAGFPYRLLGFYLYPLSAHPTTVWCANRCRLFVAHGSDSLPWWSTVAESGGYW